MELPKLLWLKRNHPSWNEIDLAFDLADFLSYKMTGSTTRSVCTLVCKWGWIPETFSAKNDIIVGDWEDDLVAQFGLEKIRHLARGAVYRVAILKSWKILENPKKS